MSIVALVILVAGVGLLLQFVAGWPGLAHLATFVWESALGSGALTLVVVETDMKIVLLLTAYFVLSRVLPM